MKDSLDIEGNLSFYLFPPCPIPNPRLYILFEVSPSTPHHILRGRCV